MLRLRRLVFAAMLAVSSTLLAFPAFADPPVRAGRIAGIDGAVTVATPDAPAPEIVPINYPVAAGMRFASTAGSRAELDFGYTNARIDGHTEIEVVALDDKVIGLRLLTGSIDVRVRALIDEHIIIGTSDGQVVLTQAGAYRIDAPGPGASSAGDAPYRALSHVAVFAGVAQVHSPHGSDDVFAGEAVDIDSPHATLRYGRADTIWLDDWAAGREQEIAAAAAEAARYMDTDIAGAGDLNDAGVWEDTADYGAVWYPDSVPADWAPYQYGAWSWVAPWGWTWIDQQPWGFAPFHYGRWVHVHGRWGWNPGERHHRQVYAPALVNFVGDRSYSRQRRPGGWVPLAPGDTYTPPYAHGTGYVRDINAGHGWQRRPGGGTDHDGRRADDGRNGTPDGTPNAVQGNGVITTTIRLPPGTVADWRDQHRRQHPGTDTNQPIAITNDTFNRPTSPRNPAITGGVPSIAGTTPAAITPLTTNPAGQPPAAVTLPQTVNIGSFGRVQIPARPAPTEVPGDVPHTREQDIPHQFDNAGTTPFAPHGFVRSPAPDPVGQGPQTPANPVQPQPAANPVDAPHTRRQDIPHQFGNAGTAPIDPGTFTRYRNYAPAAQAPQAPPAIPTPVVPQAVAPQIAPPEIPQPHLITPPRTYEPPTPIQAPQYQPPAGQSPAPPRSINLGMYGHVQIPANVGQGNTGQGNIGQGTTGGANTGH